MIEQSIISTHQYGSVFLEKYQEKNFRIVLYLRYINMVVFSFGCKCNKFFLILKKNVIFLLLKWNIFHKLLNFVVVLEKK